MEVKCDKCGCIIPEEAVMCTRCGAPRSSLVPSRAQLKDLNEEAYCAVQGIPYTPTPGAAPKVVETPTSERKIGWGLGFGLLFLPYIFCWFLLRRGYSRGSRIIGFSWLGFLVLFLATRK